MKRKAPMSKKPPMSYGSNANVKQGKAKSFSKGKGKKGY